MKARDGGVWYCFFVLSGAVVLYIVVGTVVITLAVGTISGAWHLLIWLLEAIGLL